MIKRHSIRWRIWQSVSEIIVGTVCLFIFLLCLSFFLGQIGVLSITGGTHFLLDSSNISVSDIKREMNGYHYDYIVFDNLTNRIVDGRYVKSDKSNFEEGKQIGEDLAVGHVVYRYSSNNHLTLITRQSNIPEFTDFKLRFISYNQFTYGFLIISEVLLIIFSLYRLIREFSDNFQNIQNITIKMGEIVGYPQRKRSKILEFDRILIRLHNKSDELASLVENERLEKKDLSFQVAALSHDVRTPLTVLKGNIELLEMTDITEQQADFISSMKNSLAVFDRYFNSMISYSQLLNNDNDYENFIVLEEFLTELSVELEELSVTYEVDYNLNSITNVKMFRGNTLALNRAIMNIFVNACQHAKEREKKVIFLITDDEEFLNFEIWNNGIAFSEVAKKNADKLFFTEDVGRSGKHYGIGLAFAKGVALRHKGFLILENPDFEGAKVILKIRK